MSQNNRHDISRGNHREPWRRMNEDDLPTRRTSRTNKISSYHHPSTKPDCRLSLHVGSLSQSVSQGSERQFIEDGFELNHWETESNHFRLARCYGFLQQTDRLRDAHDILLFPFGPCLLVGGSVRFVSHHVALGDFLSLHFIGGVSSSSRIWVALFLHWPQVNKVNERLGAKIINGNGTRDHQSLELFLLASREIIDCDQRCLSLSNIQFGINQKRFSVALLTRMYVV